MATRRTASRPKKATGTGILLRYRDADTEYGVSRNTVTSLTRTLGLNETQVIHVALAKLARQTLPQYAPDDGPLTEKQYGAIATLVAQTKFKSSKRRLF